MPALKYECCKGDCIMLLQHLTYALKYRLPHSRWSGFLDIAFKWKNEEHYQFREAINSELQRYAREKYNLRPPNLLDVTGKRIWLALPFTPEGKMFGIGISWTDAKSYTFFASVEDDVWMLQYARLLLKLAYDIKKIVQPIAIDGKTLKVGEWLAALMFELSGDRAGMLATLDEAEDRK